MVLSIKCSAKSLEEQQDQNKIAGFCDDFLIHYKHQCTGTGCAEPQRRVTLDS